jgi:hypothetical protein
MIRSRLKKVWLEASDPTVSLEITGPSVMARPAARLPSLAIGQAIELLRVVEPRHAEVLDELSQAAAGSGLGILQSDGTVVPGPVIQPMFAMHVSRLLQAVDLLIDVVSTPPAAASPILSPPAGRTLSKDRIMVDYDSLVRCRDAAWRCNEAARSGAALFQGEPLAPDWLPFPRGESLSGQLGEPLEVAVRRGSASKWLGELQRALDDWKASAYPISANSPLQEIKRAAVSLGLGSVHIGKMSYSTAHEGAMYRAMAVQECLSGQRSELPDGATLDLHGHIEQEFLKAIEGKTSSAGPLAPPGTNPANSTTEAPSPATLLTSWGEILGALGLKKQDREKVSRLNKTRGGPIKPGKRGQQPIVDRLQLLEWWNRLTIEYEVGENRNRDTGPTTAASYEHGRDGVAIPDIGGGERKRRADRKP